MRLYNVLLWIAVAIVGTAFIAVAQAESHHIGTHHLCDGDFAVEEGGCASMPADAVNGSRVLEYIESWWGDVNMQNWVGDTFTVHISQTFSVPRCEQELWFVSVRQYAYGQYDQISVTHVCTIDNLPWEPGCPGFYWGP